MKVTIVKRFNFQLIVCRLTQFVIEYNEPEYDVPTANATSYSRKRTSQITEHHRTSVVTARFTSSSYGTQSFGYFFTGNLCRLSTQSRQTRYKFLRVTDDGIWIENICHRLTHLRKPSVRFSLTLISLEDTSKRESEPWLAKMRLTELSKRVGNTLLFVNGLYSTQFLIKCWSVKLFIFNQFPHSNYIYW